MILFGLLVLLAAAFELGVRLVSRGHWRKLGEAAEHELAVGGLPGLLRARAAALRGAAHMPDNAENAATLALSNAMLASEYGLETTSAALLAVDVVERAPRASRRARSLALASRALVAATAGDPAGAEPLARQSLSLGQEQAAPQFALGRVRFRQGDPVAASHAFRAALLREPDFVEARVAWAESELELGERTRARDVLLATSPRTRDQSRARLLLAELSPPSLDSRSDPGAWQGACVRDEAVSPFVAASCDLVRAERAWRSQDRGRAVEFADSAGRRRPADPRLLGRAAQLLASLGAVDRASSCLDEATRLASANLPSLTWAKIAIELGRGHLADPPGNLARSSSPVASLLLARVALASGGIQALGAIMPELRKQDWTSELASLALLSDGNAGVAAESDPALADPVRSYVEGLRARLAGKPLLAASLLGRALHGHGDACRAAGEYLAVSRALGRAPDADAFAPLEKENAHCVNLPAASAASQRVGDRPGKPSARKGTGSR